MRIVLASTSEWRARIIRWIDPEAVIMGSDVNEEIYDIEDPETLVITLAQAKARAVYERLVGDPLNMSEGRQVVIGADTVIVAGGNVVGKPRNEEHAREVIGMLAGTTHAVITGMCVYDVDSGEYMISAEATEITLAPMSETEIRAYVKTGEWRGKAGGYQILRSIDAYVEKMEGSVTNVIGLPVGLLVEMLDEWGISLDVSAEKAVVAELQSVIADLDD